MHRLFLAVLATATGVCGAVSAAETPVEALDFGATPDYEATLEYLAELTADCEFMKLDSFGLSAQGRKLPLVIVSGDEAFTPEAASKSGKAVVLIQNGIHAGEIDGKDASLMLLRDLAEGDHAELLEGLILLIVPIYNVDGHGRISPHNRPNQDGPRAGMGFRTSADGHDLNRDHLKLETVEARAMIGLFNAWRPDLHVDNHVTDGVDHDWVLTYSWAEAPQLASPVHDWMQSHMPAVLRATVEAGHPVGPYVDLIDRTDPAKGINSSVGEPRYATGYYPLRNRPSILVENHSYKSYRARVLANRDFMLALFREIAADPKSLMVAVRNADRFTTAAGKKNAGPSSVVLRYRTLAPKEKIVVPFRDWYTTESVVMGSPLLSYRPDSLREIEVFWAHRPESAFSVPRPRGYLVLPGWPVIEQRLADHGLQVEILTEEARLDVETMRLSNAKQISRARPSYQGLTPIDVEVERAMETRSFPRGTLWIPADQPDFEVAAQLLEPEAPDSLVRWGLLSTVLERKEYIEPRNLEVLAREMLEDPNLAEQWHHALEDESFAGDAGARYLWWYRRTPFWDETVGLMPVMRRLSPLDFSTTPWKERDVVTRDR